MTFFQYSSWFISLPPFLLLFWPKSYGFKFSFSSFPFAARFARKRVAIHSITPYRFRTAATSAFFRSFFC